MNAYLFPGVTGLLLGVTLHWAGFSRPAALRDALGLRRSYGLRSGLYVLGASMALTALLCWLAVIDVDGIVVLPLSAGALAGGAIFGIAAGLCGFTPVTAFAGVGGGPVLEALSAVAGCLLAVFALPALNGPLSALQAMPPYSAATLFEVTLDEPFLLGGGFLGQGCAGLLLMAIALCIPSPRPRKVSAEDSFPADAAAPVEAAAEAKDAEDTKESEAEDAAPLLLPAAAPEETFVALLPGEEPLVVDTQLDTENDAEDNAEATDIDSDHPAGYNDSTRLDAATSEEGNEDGTHEAEGEPPDGGTVAGGAGAGADILPDR